MTCRAGTRWNGTLLFTPESEKPQFPGAFQSFED
jgi:hypothetical protein